VSEITIIIASACTTGDWKEGTIEEMSLEAQWRRLQGTGHVPPLYKRLGTGAPRVEEQQTRNWLNCTDYHESARQND